MLFSSNTRAISPVITTIMLIAIAVTASLVTYVFVMNYMDLTAAKSGKTIQIQGASVIDGKLNVYVQNTGKGTVNFNSMGCIYVNSELKNCIIDKSTLLAGETATLTINNFTVNSSAFTVKVVTVDGISYEDSFNTPNS